MRKKSIAISVIILCCFSIVMLWAGDLMAVTPHHSEENVFPRSLESYNDSNVNSVLTILKNRIKQEPFNLVATLIFLIAIVHCFITGRFMAISHKWEYAHKERIRRGESDRDSVHHGAELFHFLGEVEAVFGIWAIALMVAIIGFYDWNTVVNYIGYNVNFTEAAFVVVIMTLAATRPILKLSENLIKMIADRLGGTLAAGWLTTLTIGPMLGSFITEPAAMTISALILGRIFYQLEPSNKFKYATLGLLFLNISVGGTLTNFAAPPVLMVAGPWEWTSAHMLTHFGWKAVLGILLSNGVYFLVFRREMAKLEEKSALMKLKDEIQKRYLSRSKMNARFDHWIKTVSTEQGTISLVKTHIQEALDEIRKHLETRYIPELLEEGVSEDMVQEAFARRFEEIKLHAMRRGFPALLPEDQRGIFTDPNRDQRDDPVPVWVTVIHVFFMLWTIVNAHHPPMFVLGLLFFLGFAQVTKPYQNRVDLKPAMLVGFFLAGLVIHGGVQAWWIAPIIGNLSEIPLMIGAMILSGFNDNAAITFLSTLVPNFTDSLKYAVVAGAVTGGGLTIIANAPNPAGVSILKKYFNDEVSPAGILLGALVPTIIVLLCFLFFR